jgi:hypothetical protein
MFGSAFLFLSTTDLLGIVPPGSAIKGTPIQTPFKRIYVLRNERPRQVNSRITCNFCRETDALGLATLCGW